MNLRPCPFPTSTDRYITIRWGQLSIRTSRGRACSEIAAQPPSRPLVSFADTPTKNSTSTMIESLQRNEHTPNHHERHHSLAAKRPDGMWFSPTPSDGVLDLVDDGLLERPAFQDGCRSPPSPSLSRLAPRSSLDSAASTFHAGSRRPERCWRGPRAAGTSARRRCRRRWPTRVRPACRYGVPPPWRRRQGPVAGSRPGLPRPGQQASTDVAPAKAAQEGAQGGSTVPPCRVRNASASQCSGAEGSSSCRPRSHRPGRGAGRDAGPVAEQPGVGHSRVEVIWIRSGWLRDSIYWVLLFWGRFSVTHYPAGGSGR